MAEHQDGTLGGTLLAPPGLVARATGLLRRTRAADDFLWARATRPAAALALAVLHRFPLTPNGLSLASLGVGLASCVAYAWWPGWGGLLMAWVIGQLAFTLDCMDGMLARAKGLLSPCGTALDFLGDALKQMALFPAVGYRLWVESGRPTAGWDAWPLWAALLGGPLVAGALALTTFLRSPEVTGRRVRARREVHDHSPRGRLMAAVAFLMNYPSWILLPVLLGRMDLLLIVSLPLYAMHLVHSLITVARRLSGQRHYREQTSPVRALSQQGATVFRS